MVEVFALGAVLLVTASFPFYVYAAYIMIEADPVLWGDVKRHALYTSVGLTLNTIPVVFWMIPQLFRQFGGLSTVHAFLGLQAYALLVLALNGVWKIYRAKRAYSGYEDPSGIELTDLDPERMSGWSTQVRLGVIGWMGFWTLAYVTGMLLYL